MVYVKYFYPKSDSFSLVVEDSLDVNDDSVETQYCGDYEFASTFMKDIANSLYADSAKFQNGVNSVEDIKDKYLFLQARFADGGGEWYNLDVINTISNMEKV